MTFQIEDLYLLTLDILHGFPQLVAAENGGRRDAEDDAATCSLTAVRVSTGVSERVDSPRSVGAGIATPAFLGVVKKTSSEAT